MHGEALALALTGSPAGDALAEAQTAGIRLRVCRNSMRSAGVDDDRLAPGAVVVPASWPPTAAGRCGVPGAGPRSFTAHVCTE